MVRPEWPYGAACKQILSDESEGRSEAGQLADEARSGQITSSQANAERLSDAPHHRVGVAGGLEPARLHRLLRRVGDGRIYQQSSGPESMRWFWSLYGVFGLALHDSP